MAADNHVPSDLRRLEVLCQAFYGEDLSQQHQAHAVLLPMVNNPDSIPQLQSILAHSNHLQALLFAAAGLTNLFTQHWLVIPDKQKDETRQFLLNYLYQRGPDMLQGAPEILGHFVRLLCRIVKLFWLENLKNQTIVEQVHQFLQASTPHWIIGLDVFASLTQDMHPVAGANMPRQRRTAIAFRDTALPVIFKVAIQTLQQFQSGAVRVPNRSEESKLLKQVLQLTHNCLSFDFMGSMSDETTEEQLTVMIPHGWSILKEQNISKLMFDLYDDCWRDPHGARVDCGRLCLSSLVLIAALRRSFFPKETERLNHIMPLIEGTTNIIRNKIGLEHDGCYHELCRLLGKVNSASQLSEIYATTAFADWIEQLFQFTMESLDDWRRLPNSKHYLLGVWIHMMSPLQFIKVQITNLDSHIKQITIAYIMSRLRLAEAIANEGEADFENPLFHEVLRSEQLEVLANLGKCRYSEIATSVLELFQETRICMQNNVISELVFQEKITWLVYMIGALISGHASGKMPFSAAEDKAPTDLINGKLASQIFELISETNKFVTSPESLELGYLYFLEQFRKVYIGEHARQVVENNPSDGLFKVLGVEESDAVLDLVIQKIGFNLQNRMNMESVLKRTLLLLHELASGINIVHCNNRSPHLIISGKLMLKNPTVKFILANHSSDQFGFRNIPKYGKYRSIYYFSLSKLLFLDIKDDKDKFELFMRPFSELFDKFWQQTQEGKNIDVLRNADFKLPIIGLVRDLRGISQACNSADPYFLLFSWLVNKPKQTGESRIHLFTWTADVWWDDPDVCIPLLKFMSEFVHNKAQRITFEQFSAFGIILFKEVSSILMTYGSRILKTTQLRQGYREKYKGLAIALEMFGRVLSGNYVVFGVFEVYGDSALSNSLKLCLEMCLAIPDEDLQAYLKSLKPYYSFLDLATKNFMGEVMELSCKSLAKVIHAVEDGLCSFEPNVSMQSCSIVDNIVTHFCNKKASPESEGQVVRKFLLEEPTALRRILQLMFQLVITGECVNSWSISRPLLGLILLYEDEFFLIQRQLADQHLDEKKQQLEQYFVELMNGVEANVSVSNKETFTRNLYQFAQSVRMNIS